MAPSDSGPAFFTDPSGHVPSRVRRRIERPAAARVMLLGSASTATGNSSSASLAGQIQDGKKAFAVQKMPMASIVPDATEIGRHASTVWATARSNVSRSCSGRNGLAMKSRAPLRIASAMSFAWFNALTTTTLASGSNSTILARA